MKMLLAGLVAATAITAVSTAAEAQPYGPPPGYGHGEGWRHGGDYGGWRHGGGYGWRHHYWGPPRPYGWYGPRHYRHCFWRHGYRVCRGW